MDIRGTGLIKIGSTYALPVNEKLHYLRHAYPLLMVISSLHSDRALVNY